MKFIALLFMLMSVSAFTQDAEKGKALFATCVQCHGADGYGMEKQKAPRIAGQHDWYIVLSLQKFKSGERKNPTMLPFIKKLSDKDFSDLAAYISKLK